MRSTQDGFFAKTEIIKVELVVILILSIVIYLLAGYYNLMERVVDFSRHHEHWQMDEFITVSVFLVLALAIFSIRRWREVVASEIILIQSNKDLQKALSEIKQLKGIVRFVRHVRVSETIRAFGSRLKSISVIIQRRNSAMGSVLTV
jgi:hypothetical protein